MCPNDPQLPILLAVETQQNIYERIMSILRSKGRKESARGFSSSLGLSPTYMSQLRDRCLRDPRAVVDSETAVKIANSLGVSVEELLGHSTARRTDERYPSRADAVVAARALGFSQRSIDAAFLESPPTDPGRLWWFRRIEAEESRIIHDSFAPGPRLKVEVTRRSKSSR